MTQKKKELAFETIVARLEEIAHQLEAGDTKLEQALALFEEGIGLARAGQRRLDEAERKIEILKGDDSVDSFEPDEDPTDSSA